MTLARLLSKSPILFSQGWEDHRVIEKALEIKKDDVVASIVASGDNVLNLLLFEPKRIFAFDISIAQIYEMKLKLTVIENLSHSEFLTLLGYDGTKKQRLDAFYKIKDKLDPGASNFWEKHKKMILKGLAFQGRWNVFSSYWKGPQKFLLGKQFNQYLKAETKEEREEIYQKRFNRPLLKFLSRIIFSRIGNEIIFLSRRTSGKKIPKSYNLYEAFRNFTHRYFVDIPCVDNQYHYWAFTGKMPEDRKYWQPYLQEQNYEKLRRNIHRITIIHKDFYNGLKSFENESIDKFYLSDMFAWMNTENMNKNFVELIRVSKNKAKMIFFGLNYDRGIPEIVRKYVKTDMERNKALWKEERYGFYTFVYLLDIVK